MTIAQRLKATAVAGITITLVLAGSGRYEASKIEAGGKLVGQAARINVFMLQARRSEKDFFARLDPKYVALVDSAVENGRAEVAAIREVSDDPRAVAIDGYLVDYQQKFHQVADLDVQRGITEDLGMRGALRGVIKAAEDRLNALENDALKVTMLMLRRHEKDYLLRLDAEKYGARFDATIEEMEFGIALADIPNSAQDELTGLVQQYATAFAALLSLDVERETIYQEMRAAVHQVEPAVDEFQAAVSAEASTEAAFLKVVALGVATTAIILLIFSNWQLSKAVVDPLSGLVSAATKIAAGDFSDRVQVDREDEIGQLAHSFSDMSVTIERLVEEVGRVAQGAREGNLRVRADHSTFEGSYASLVENVNEMVEAFVGPISVTSKYVASISSGQIPKKITESYSGDFNEIKDNLNGLIDVMEGLIGETNRLAASARAGQLDARGDSDAYAGAWRELIEGINDTLDSVIEPIAEASEVLERVAARDLTARVQGDYKGDHARIKDSLNRAVDNLDGELSQVTASAEQVASASDQISAGSQSLAQGTAKQAGTLEEVSSSLQEMESMTGQNTANAQEARGLTEKAREQAERGVGAMKRLAEAMEEIKTSSDETAKIVKTIDEIAFQTNLLALNAAVEAARAGDAGKGFAVVAEEVRNLAMRSADAAKDTSQMIEESVKNAEGGVKLNLEVLENLEEINLQVNKVSDVMGEIAAAAEQQTESIRQVTTAVEQMNQVTQQTAANAEESSSASEELSAQADEMRALVSAYSLSVGKTSSSGRRRAAPSAKEAAPQFAASGGGNGDSNGIAGSIPFDDDSEVTLAGF